MDRSLQWRRRPASLLFVAVAFLAAAASAAADNYDAKARALAAYHPDPIAVANSFNRAVHRHARTHAPSALHLILLSFPHANLVII